MAVTIYHNPRCSKSRGTLEILEQSGTEYTVVDYQAAPPTATRIIELAALLGLPVRDLLREGEEVVRGADDLPELADGDALATWIAAHPRALQRPIVVDDDRAVAVIGRPPDNVRALLET